MQWLRNLWSRIRDLFLFKEHEELRRLREGHARLVGERDAAIAALQAANEKLARKAAAHLYRHVFWTERRYDEAGDHGPFCPVCYETQAVPLTPIHYGTTGKCPKCGAIYGSVFENPDKPRAQQPPRGGGWLGRP